MGPKLPPPPPALIGGTAGMSSVNGGMWGDRFAVISGEEKVEDAAEALVDGGARLCEMDDKGRWVR